MTSYIIRRILLLPVTLFAIILVNFVILNLAPGDPVTVSNLGTTGEATRGADDAGVTGEDRYLQFREHYGLTLPILFNLWPTISSEKVSKGLKTLTQKDQMSASAYHDLRTLWGDRARFIMPLLMQEATKPENPPEIKAQAANLFVRGAIRQGHVGPTITSEQRAENREIAQTNLHLSSLRISSLDTSQEMEEKIAQLVVWYQDVGGLETFSTFGFRRFQTFFFETRFFRYLSRVVLLDFGTLRNDNNKTVIREVAKRIKYSLTLAVFPMLITFGLCQIFGMWMAVRQNTYIDYSFNIFFLVLFAIPIFVVAPFLIEKVALHNTLPFTNIPIPYSGFHSPNETYEALTSSRRLADVMLHLFLPLVAIMYGTLAVQARLSRTAFLEVMRQDYVRTARAKGLSKFSVLIKHVGRNGAITIVTSLAASLGVVLGGSLIVETLFEINGFGRFFYDAILNRDYNVVLFSAFAGSFLTLIGYFLADISYTFLDPRVSLD